MPSSLDIFLSRILDLNGPHRRRRKNFQATTKHKNRLKRKEIKSDLIDVILIILFIIRVKKYKQFDWLREDE